MQIKKQQLELDMEQQTGSKLRKEYVKAVYCRRAYLTYMQNTSCEILGWKKHKLKSRLLEEISITSDMQMTPPLWQTSEVTQSCLTLCNPMDYSLSGSSLHGIFQARVLEWGAITFSIDSPSICYEVMGPDAMILVF